MTFRVALWGTGNMGKLALEGILENPALELVGVWVSNPEKVGVDAGVLAGTNVSTGITATSDLAEIVALNPDCVVYTAMADNRLPDALEDLRMILSAGINVVSCAPVFLQYPFDVVPQELITPLEDAASDGGVSLWVNGIDPGFASDLLPLALSGTSQRIEQIRCSVIWDYSSYHNPAVLFDIMGFGQPMEQIPFLLQPGVLQIGWGSVVRQLAKGLDITLDAVVETYTRGGAPEAFDIATGHIPQGSMAALRFEVSGMLNDRAVLVLEHVCRLREDLEPEWPQPAQPGGSYRIEITGEPHYTMDLCTNNSHGFNDAALVGAAMRIVNAIPDVVNAQPGLLTALDLPLITGRGLVQKLRAPNSKSHENFQLHLIDRR